MNQRIITSENGYIELDSWIEQNACKRILLVCDDSILYMDGLNKHLDDLSNKKVKTVIFRDFKSNPLYENVVNGVEVFRAQRCDGIMAVGGGSAIDVAKCIKLYSGLPGDGEDGAWLKSEEIPNTIPFIAMPTTAGTGSEATRYSVIYYNDTKQSITSESFIPDTVLMDPTALKTLPLYQKKSTMMDALCHAIESFWSVNSNEESKGYSKSAIKSILENMEGYLSGTDKGNKEMLLAAHTAGKAINITQTTAGHAMCYKITSLFGLAHGHAAILCDRVLFGWMAENTDKCVDPRGEEYLVMTLGEIAEAMDCGSVKSAALKLNEIFDSLCLKVPTPSREEFEVLIRSVNPVRLKNHPVRLDQKTIELLYHKIFSGDKNEG